MSCDKFKELIMDSVLEESHTHERSELQQHIRTCNACRIEYEQIQSAVQALKPDGGEGLSLVEKLQIENKLYEARLNRLSSRHSGNLWFKRLAAIAAAIFFFFLGYSMKTAVKDNRPIQDMASSKEGIDERTNLEYARLYGQRISPRGLLLIAKGERVLRELASRK
jgi:hypothetical protein